MTERLYYTDSYLTSFSAAVSDHADGGRRVYLDRSAFYPTSGGQPNDLGTLDGIPVLDVIDEGDRVAHLLAEPHSASVVSGLVDWGRRFDHMQQHTGQHLLSAVFAEMLNAETVSVHFGAEYNTLDLDVGDVSLGELADVQDRANAVAVENRPVRVTFEDAATATGLRKATDRTGMLRVVTIAELDRSACGGTHVSSTGEIGAILIRRTERMKKRVRVDFLCGLRAGRRARADFLALSAAASTFSAALDDVPSLVEHQREEIRQGHGAREHLLQQLSAFEARDRVGAAAPGPRGLRVVTQHIAAGTVDTLRALALAVAGHENAIFVGSSGDPAAIMLATSASSGVDAGATLKPLLATLGGRGGGSPRLAQGSLPGGEQVRLAVDSVVAAIS